MGGDGTGKRLGYEERLAVVEAELYATAENVFDTRPEAFRRDDYAGVPRNVLRVIELVASFWVSVYESGGVWDSRKRAFTLHALLFIAYLEEGWQREAEEQLRQLLEGRFALADRRILSEAAWKVLCEIILRRGETKDPHADFAREVLLEYQSQRDLQAGHELGETLGREDRQIGLDLRTVARRSKGKPWQVAGGSALPTKRLTRGLEGTRIPNPHEAVEILEAVAERKALLDRSIATETAAAAPNVDAEARVMAYRQAGHNWSDACRLAGEDPSVGVRMRKRLSRGKRA